MPFYSTGPHYCPKCKGLSSKLELIEENYSGCGVDWGQCTKCKHVFEISYVVNKYLDITIRVNRNANNK